MPSLRVYSLRVPPHTIQTLTLCLQFIKAISLNIFVPQIKNGLSRMVNNWLFCLHRAFSCSEISLTNFTSMSAVKICQISTLSAQILPLSSHRPSHFGIMVNPPNFSQIFLFNSLSFPAFGCSVVTTYNSIFAMLLNLLGFPR